MKNKFVWEILSEIEIFIFTGEIYCLGVHLPSFLAHFEPVNSNAKSGDVSSVVSNWIEAKK